MAWGRFKFAAESGMPRRASASHILFDLAGPDVFGQRLAECATAVFDVVEAFLPRPRAVSGQSFSSSGVSLSLSLSFRSVTHCLPP